MATKTAKKPGKKKAKKLAAPVTGIEDIGWQQLYLLGKVFENAAKKLKADADSAVAPGAYPVRAVVEVEGDAIVAERVKASKGKSEIVVTVGPTALLVALLIGKRPEVLRDDADLPTGELDATIGEALATLADVWSNEETRERVQRIGEQAAEALERLAAEAGFTKFVTTGAHDGKPGAVRCDPAVHVRSVMVSEPRKESDEEDDADE